mmetsp:Transcript_37882/g.119441  ORF Transcript_37882/g.119441 Transcript_37882/m.119441 type:complete len:762 (+) Transcript_37882:76-2361(+)
MGVAIIADVFMGAIERITSKKTQAKDPSTGKMVTVKVWNATVANLTLMALGSSAPEILLNVKDILQNDFYAKAMGPSTIVGSAAFNLLVIIAVCVSALPPGETRLIRDLGVYAVTASFSVFAYLWLLIILLGTTPNRVDVPEGIITFLFFPLVVWIAFLADRGKLPGTAKPPPKDAIERGATKAEIEEKAQQVKDKYGHHLTDEQVAALIDFEFRDGPPQSRAFHRVAAIRMISRGKQVKDRSFEKGRRLSRGGMDGQPLGVVVDGTSVLSLEETNYVVFETAGFIEIKVCRSGDDVSETARVKYRTVDGEAKAGSDYESAQGILEFGPGDRTPQSFKVKIFESKESEDPEDFYVEIEVEGGVAHSRRSRARIMIIDENHPGKLCFDEEPPERHVPRPETDKEISFSVVRKRGCDGVVSCTVCTEADSATEGKDFQALEETLTFKQGETTKTFTVKLLGKMAEGSSEVFRVLLKDPTGGVMFDASTDGGSESCIMTVFIDEPRTSNVWSILQVNHDQMQLAHAAWRDQFTSAVTCNGAAEDELTATPVEWIVHFFALPWKLFFALVPPVQYFGGWLCFFVALGMIAIVTILIGDLAEMLGCALGISSFATAITFVALGTSLPDTFASRQAAVQDTCADASVGNVTGSNSVNVFLGLGLPWMIAAIYWGVSDVQPGSEWHGRYPEEAKRYPGGGFIVKADGLGLSVGVFCACSVLCLLTLAARRKFLGAELGGDKKRCWATSAFFVLLWVVYIVVSIVNDDS